MIAASAADQALYPAAQCAAFYLGREDFAADSTFLETDPSALVLAAAYHSAALRLAPDRQAEIEGLIAEQRPLMAKLFEAFIDYGDAQSGEVQETLLQVCGAFAAQAPEFDGLR